MTHNGPKICKKSSGLLGLEVGGYVKCGQIDAG